MTTKIQHNDFENAILEEQKNITQALSKIDGKAFDVDCWEKEKNPKNLSGYGITMVLKNGNVFEQAGVNISVVEGKSMPASATAKRPDLAGCAYRALGLSLVIHPDNPYIPTSHMNVRLFIASQGDQIKDWWFGGGFDLTPYYPYEEDCIFWHKKAKEVCEPFGEKLYPRFKKWCDEYFYLSHRQETRGIGGLFFDHFNELPFEDSQAFSLSVLRQYAKAYLPIVRLRMQEPFTEKEKHFQKYRRGRYVEFNLLFDRGTHFGIQSGGRTESILMSLPPEVRFEYQYEIEKGSKEANLLDYLKPIEWIKK